jgi:hypothetical protein
MADKKVKKFTFKYVYPDNLRDYYVNGCWGGTTPRNEIYMHLYSERHPIPKEVVHDVKEDGTLSEKYSVSKGGEVVRLIQSTVVMDIGTAKSIKDWLDKFINLIEKKDENKEKKEG